jgi:hypothetical protein
MRLVTLAIVVAAVLFGVEAAAVQEQQLPYSGVALTPSGAPVADGLHQMEFRLYTGATASEPVWTELQLVQTRSGSYQVVLGQSRPLPLTTGQQYWLEVLCDGASLGRMPLALLPSQAETKVAARSLQELHLNPVQSAAPDGWVRAGLPTLGGATPPQPLTTTFWALTGNAGTDPGNNFLGTTDNRPLVIRTDDRARVRITTGGQIEVLNSARSVSLGEGAGISQDVNAFRNNVFVGYQAGSATETGTQNVAVGSGALSQNIDGSSNTALGSNAMSTLTAGNYNTAIGYGADVLDGLTNATAIGAFARAERSNTVVIGSIQGVNGATSTADVGIGTTTPTNRLHVVSTADPLRLEGLQVNSALVNVLVVDASGVVKKRSLSGFVGSTAWLLTGNTLSGGEVLGSLNPQPLVLVTGNTERMRITETGEVVVQNQDPTGATKVIIQAGANQASAGVNLLEWVDEFGITQGVIDAGGLVGIGTTTPVQKLHVDGRGSVSAVFVEGGVGVGTVRPLATLHVYDEGTLTPGATQVVIQAGTNQSGVDLLQWQNNSGDPLGVIRPDGSVVLVYAPPARQAFFAVANPSGVPLIGIGPDPSGWGVGVYDPTPPFGQLRAGMGRVGTEWRMGVGDLAAQNGVLLSWATTGTANEPRIVVANGNLTTPVFLVDREGDVTVRGTTVALPNIPSVPTATDVLVWNGGNVQRSSASGLISGLAWALTGNGITSAWNGSSGNFLGTTNAQPLVIATTSTAPPQPIQFWTNNTERMRITETGEVVVQNQDPTGATKVIIQAGANQASAGVNLLEWVDEFGITQGVIDAGGLVGIGTTTPVQKLHVDGRGSVSAVFVEGGVGVGTVRPLATLHVYDEGTLTPGATQVVIQAGTNQSGVDLLQWQNNSGDPLGVIRPDGSVVLVYAPPARQAFFAVANPSGVPLIGIGPDPSGWGVGVYDPTPPFGQLRAGMGRVGTEWRMGVGDLAAQNGVLLSWATTGTANEPRIVVANGNLTTPVFLVDREGDVTVRGTTVALPNIPSVPTATDVLVWNGGNVQRSSASGLISGLAWALTGNGITSAWNGSSGNFLGTTNAQPLVIATTSTAPPQPIQFWTNNVERMRITAAGEVVVQNQDPTGATKVIIQAGANQASAGVNLLEWVDEFGITQGVIDAGGLVGIGTTTPVQKLHVDGRGSVSAVFVEGGVGVGTVRPLATLHVYDEGTLTPGATQVVIQAGTNQSGVDLLQWQNNSGDPLGVIRPDGSVVLVYAPPARQAFFAVANPSGVPLIGIGPDPSGWGVGVYDPTPPFGQLRAGMGRVGTEWRMGVGDLAAQNGVLLSWATTGTANEPRIVVANGNLTTPVFLVDREGDVTVRGTTVALPNIPSVPTATDVLVWNGGNVQRSSASGLISGLAWALTGNGITSAWNGSSGNFLGTTNAQPLVIATTSTAPPQPIQFWTNNVERMRITAAGEVVVQNQDPTGATKVIIQAGANQASAGVNLLEWVDEFGITQGVIDAGGLVGIGTTTPVQKLHVDGRGSVSAVFVEGGVGVGTVRPLATLHVYDEGTLTPGATQVVIQAGTNQSGVDLLQWQNNSGDPLGVIRPDGSVVLVYAPPARQAFFAVANPSGVPLIGIGPDPSGWGVGVYDPTPPFGQLRAGMGRVGTEWRMGVGDLAAQNGVLLSWATTGTANEPRIVVANGNLTTPVFLVDREGDVTVRGTTVALPNIPSVPTATDVLVWNGGNVQRSSASGLISGLAWALTGNGITSAWNGSSGNFLGTTNAQPLVIATTSTAPPQPIQFWTNNVERMRITATGEVVVQNQDPTGATKVIIRAGANQASVNLLEWQNNTGLPAGFIDASGFVAIGDVNDPGFTGASAYLHVYSNTAQPAAVFENGIVRIGKIGLSGVSGGPDLQVWDEPGATQVVIQAGTNQSGVDLLQWQNNSGDPLGVIRPDGSVVLVYAPPARQAFFAVANPSGVPLIGIGPDPSGWGVGVYDPTPPFGQLRAGMGRVGTEWRMGVGDLAAQNGVLLSWATTGTANEPRIVVANGNLTTPVFLVDREGDVTVRGTTVALPNIPSVPTATDVLVWNGGNVQRSSASGLISGLAWALTGNGITSAWNGSSGNFLGTTNAQPLVIATTSTAPPQPIQFWTNNVERMRITAAGEVVVQNQDPTGATKVIIRAGASQASVNLLEWQNNTGLPAGFIDASGFVAIGDVNDPGFTGASAYLHVYSNTAQPAAVFENGIVRIGKIGLSGVSGGPDLQVWDEPGATQVVIQAGTNQSGVDLLQWQNNSGDPLGVIRPDGSVVLVYAPPARQAFFAVANPSGVPLIGIGPDPSGWGVGVYDPTPPLGNCERGWVE